MYETLKDLGPLCLGKTENGYVLSSESCAFDAIKAEFIRHIAPGEMVIIDDSGVRSTIYAEPEKSIKNFASLNTSILHVAIVISMVNPYINLG